MSGARGQDYSFVTRLLVTPSAALILSDYISGLARDCLKESFPEFTRFARVDPSTRELN